MNWADRLVRLFRTGPLSASSRKQKSPPPRSRRVAVEPLEDRRLLSVSPTPDLVGAAGEYDFGDAPDNYGTTLAADAAYHEAVGPTLGATRDAESNGLPTTTADGDDTDGTDDEDGVTFGTIQVGQLDAQVTVNVQNVTTTAYLDAWIDFNGDGSFGGAGEMIADSITVTEGDNVIEFDVPSTAVSGVVYARFRLSTDGDLGWTGAAADGEVEDYAVTVLAPTASAGVFSLDAQVVAEDDGITSAHAADVDGDGDMDVIAVATTEHTLAWYENQGDGTFAVHAISTTNREAYVADLDGDGDVDIASAVCPGEGITWFKNDGSGNFSAEAYAPFSLGLGNEYVWPGDTDGDGDQDFIFLVDLNPYLLCYEDGAISEYVILGSYDEWDLTALIDFDGDGDIDFLSLDKNFYEITLWDNDGAGNLTASLLSFPSTNVLIDTPLQVADLDSDGDQDLIILESVFGDTVDTCQVIWLENDGEENFTSRVIGAVGSWRTPLALADMDGDGDMDLLASAEDGTLAWYENDGAGNFTANVIANSPEDAADVSAADMDGDGDLDVLAVTSDGDVLWFENETTDPGDYGDAPDSYGTSYGANGARHVPTGPTLGASRDSELNGSPNAAADGDDTTDSDDEDGVTISDIHIGESASVTVNVQNASTGALLDAWIDFDGDGEFDSDEQIADSLAVVEGDNTVTFDVPLTATLGSTYARFRLSTDGDLEATGAAADGEVEDYALTILTPIADFGDAPDSYGTLYATGGAWHYDTGPALGSTRDTDSDGQPTTDADGDDTNGDADEDGVTISDIHIGESVSVTVNVQNASTGALLDAWIDFDGDGVFDSDEQIADSLAVVEGDNTVTFDVPLTATLGSTYGRFRLSTEGDLDPTGDAADGEVEDYALTILTPIADFGDAPDSYGTLYASDGAWHYDTGPSLGSTRDTDSDGQPSTAADGDDTNGDADEDGVTISDVHVGESVSVTVNVQNASEGAKLDAWIDFDGDGVFDDDEQIADSLAVVEGDNIVTFTVPVTATLGSSYARFRLSTADDLDATGSAADGEVEDYALTILPPIADYGDAPDSYGTTYTSDGAWHYDTGPTLGATRDVDSDGQPTATADGDDTTGDADEDGVTISDIHIGESVSVTVNVQNPSEGAKLDAWIDFDGDGVFDSDEQIADSLAVVEGDNTVTFAVPLTATLGSTYARFRLSTAGDLNPTDGAADGEVEDYALTILAPIADFGDAPDSYGTTLDADGAWHLTTGPTLGSARDVDSDGQPTTGADGDDTNGDADEDGVTFVSDIIPGQTYTTVTVNVQGATSGAKLDAWIDYDGDGVFESSEQIADSVDVVNGDNLIAFDVPASAVTGETYARFRLSSDGDLAATGGATDGEVEDYAVTIIAPTTDYGDAPDTYGTTLASDGARHVGTGPTLGAARDLEPGGLPTDDAEGDDADGSDDEDGVTFVSQLIAGRTGRELTVNVQNATSGAKLDAWIDFNGDGVFSSDEQIADSVDVVEGDNTITFDVPESAIAGMSYARFRLSTAGDLDPTGAADDGEVEDYQVTIYSENLDLTPEDLGAVDFVERSGVDLSESAKAYSFTTARAGYLTLDAQLDSSGGEATIRLIDSENNIVAEVTTADGHARIDQLALASGEVYILQASGANSDVTLRICNLVELSDTAVTVHGTSDDDAFTCASGSTHALSINGIDYEFALDAIATVDFDGGEGTDSAALTGSAGDETAAFYPGHGAMTTTDSGFVVSVENTENIILNSGGGSDEVELEDSDGDDTLVATTTQMTLSGTPLDGSPYSLTANNFRYAHAYARNGGDDTATLEGSEGDDRIKAYPDFVRLFNNEFYSRAKFFDTVTIDMLGGDDSGAMIASDSADVVWAMKDDIRIARNVELAADETPDYDALAYNVTIAGCEFFTARAEGGDDWIELHDSAGKDVLIAKPHKIMMMNGPSGSVARGEEYTITARGFYHMASVADQGGDYDAAKLYDSSEEGTDVWAAAYVDGETWSTMTSPSRLLYEVTSFEQVGGYGFNGDLGEGYGTNVKDHAEDVDFVFEYGYWE